MKNYLIIDLCNSPSSETESPLANFFIFSFFHSYAFCPPDLSSKSHNLHQLRTTQEFPKHILVKSIPTVVYDG